MAAGLGWPAAAGAAINSVFGGAVNCTVNCTVQASGQRFCRGIVPSFDGVPIDVNVAFPPGIGQDYTAATTATVISTAGDATLSVADPGANPGHLVNGAFVLPPALQARANGGVFGALGASPLTLLSTTNP